jgi:hypothetical protein
LRQKRAKVLATPEWNVGELQAMGPTMRTMIRAALREKKFILQRLAILEDVSAEVAA